MFSSEQVYKTYFAVIDCESLSVWIPKQKQEEKGGGKGRQTEIWENKLFNKFKP